MSGVFCVALIWWVMETLFWFSCLLIGGGWKVAWRGLLWARKPKRGAERGARGGAPPRRGVVRAVGPGQVSWVNCPVGFERWSRVPRSGDAGGNPCSSDRSAYATHRRPRRDEAGSEKMHTRGRDRARDRGANRGGGCIIAGAVRYNQNIIRLQCQC